MRLLNDVLPRKHGRQKGVPMKLFRQYIYLETKRMFHSFPLILLGSLLLLALLAGIIAFCQLNTDDKQRNQLNAAIVADKDEPFVDWMISTVSGMENTTYTCTFKRLDEQTANQKLQSGEIAAAFLIPQNYVASIISGENKHVTIRVGSGQSTIISFLVSQLSEAASSFILSSEAGIYTMQEYYSLHQLSGATADELELNLQYINDIITLDKGIQTEIIEIPDSYPLSSQYMISGFVLFLLFWGLTCSKMLTSENKAFRNQLTIAGISRIQQILARGLSFLCVSLANYMILFILLCIGMAVSGFSLPDTVISDIGGLWKFAIYCLPLLLFCTFAIQLVYEATNDALSGTLLLFFSVLIMGLCSGCFYPLDYLPSSLQRLAPKIPIYQACRYGLSMLYHLSG